MIFLKRHLEWSVFFVGLIALALMNPENSSSSLCIFNIIGIESCPGDGLGHSISYTFRADFDSAIKAHFFGPFAVLILLCRIIQIWFKLYKQLTSLKNKG